MQTLDAHLQCLFANEVILLCVKSEDFSDSPFSVSLVKLSSSPSGRDLAP
jgi:hypothetical protein